MKCPYCNQEIPDGSKFCTYCGQSLESTEPETAQESSPVPEEGKKSNKKLAIGAAVVAGAAIIAAAVFVLRPSKDPKTTVIDAFKSVTAEGQTSPMEELFGASELYEKLQTESAEISMDISVNDISDETMAALTTGKLTVGAKQDIANKQYFAEMGIGYADMDIVSFQMYYDDKALSMAIPEVSDKAFGFNYADDLEGQINNSPYLGQIVKESGIDVNAFREYFSYLNKVASSGGEVFNFNALWERYKEGSQAVDDLKAAMTVVKADKKAFTVDGKEQNCSGFDVNITKDALISFLTTSKDFFMTDETIKGDFLEYFNQIIKFTNSMNQMYGTQEELSAEQTWSEMEEALTTAIEELEESMGDVHMVVYVDKKGRLASMEADTTAVIEDEECNLSLDVNLEGGYRLTANGKATFTFATAEDTLTVDFLKKGACDDTEFTGSYEITAALGTDSFTVNYDGVYTIPDSTYHIDLGLSGNDEDIFTVSTDGEVQDLEKGKAISLIVDSAKIQIPSAENLMIDLGGSYKVAPLNGTVDVPAGESFDIFTATEEEWTGVIQDMSTNLWGLMSKFQ